MYKIDNDIPNPPKTVSVAQAGKWLGVSRNTAYAAAKRGDIPTIRIGRLLRVPIVALERKLNGTDWEPPAQEAAR